MCVISKSIVGKIYPQIHSNFVDYLTNKLNKIKPYTLTHSYFEGLDYTEENDCMLYAKQQIPTSKKELNIKYSKLFDNDRIEFSNGKLKITCDGSEEEAIHVINTGILFRVPENQTLIVSMATSSSKNVRMNPAVIDATNTMPVVLIINTGKFSESTTYVCDVDVFSNNANKYKVDNKRDALNKGTVKNFNADNMNIIDLEINEVDDKYIVNVAKINFELAKGTALFIFQRKRYHKLCQVPMFGVVVPKQGSSKVFDIYTEMDISQYSYTIVQGYYPSVKFEESDEPTSSSNGGYNGWMYLYDSKYSESVSLFKQSQKLLKKLNLAKKILDKMNWNTDENINTLKEKCNIKSIKYMMKNPSTNLDTFENYLDFINKSNDNIISFNYLINVSVLALKNLDHNKKACESEGVAYLFNKKVDNTLLDADTPLDEVQSKRHADADIDNDTSSKRTRIIV